MTPRVGLHLELTLNSKENANSTPRLHFMYQDGLKKALLKSISLLTFECLVAFVKTVFQVRLDETPTYFTLGVVVLGGIHPCRLDTFSPDIFAQIHRV